MKILSNPIYRLNNQIKQNSINVTNKQSSLKEHNLNALECMSNYNIPFCSHDGIYVFDYDGSYERLETAADAVRKYNAKNVYHCASSERYIANNKVFVYADEIESVYGRFIPGTIQKVLLNFKYAKNQPFYSVDIDGNIQRFDCASSAAEALEIQTPKIYRIAAGTPKTAKGYVFLKAFDIERRDKHGKILLDENGKPLVDMKKINKARESFLHVRQNYPIISVSKDGTIKPYKNVKEFMSDTECSYQVAINAIGIEKIIQDKYILLRMEDFVEIDRFGDVLYDENNDFKLNLDKINQTAAKYFNK